MSVFKVVAIAGASGNVGRFVAQGFLDKGRYEVRLLTRDKAKLKEFEKSAAKIIEVDPRNVPDLTNALQGVDLVVSLLYGEALVDGQINLIDAAKAAGAKHYVPSEFGIDPTLTKPEDCIIYKIKDDVFQHLLKSGLDYTLVATGAFFEYFVDVLVAALEKNAVTIVGDGNIPVDTTLSSEAGYLVADVLEKPESRNAVISVVTQTVTQNEVIAIYNELTGKHVTAKYIPIEDVKAKIRANPGFETVMDQIAVVIAEGKVPPSPSVIREWFPNHKFTTVREYIAKQLAK